MEKLIADYRLPITILGRRGLRHSNCLRFSAPRSRSNTQSVVMLGLLTVYFLLLLPGIANAEKTWVLASSTNHWQARSLFCATVFTNKVWLTGGIANGEGINDEWKSENGVDWTLVTDNAPWESRYAQQTIVFNNYLWMFGGKTGEYLHFPQKDIWNSQNGADWTWLNNNAPWFRRDNHQCIVFSNKVWLMGGGRGVDDYTMATEDTNDVWSSTDGFNWTMVTEAASWAQRTSFAAVVFDGKMWVVGGYFYTYGQPAVKYSDVWSSSDGSNWTLVTDNAPWGERSSGQVVIYENKMWLMGGYAETWKNDVWTSEDGSNWTLETASAPWMARAGHICLVKDEAIWLMGGYNDGNYGNGVWIYGEKPSINTKGNGIDITNGDSSPEIADGTDFGSGIAYGHSVTQKFLIEAEGQIPLEAHVSISNSLAFFILSGKNSVTAPGTSSYINIAYSPIIEGTVTGIVYISNNSTNANNYSFMIKADGVPEAGMWIVGLLELWIIVRKFKSKI